MERIFHTRFAKKIPSVFAALALACAAGAEELVGVVQFAPMNVFAQQAVKFGVAVNNPIVPALLLTSSQQRLARTYGSLRGGDSVWLFYYADGKAPIECVAVCPCVLGAARMTLETPGATRNADGTVTLPADAEKELPERFVAFSGEHAAFASTPARAKWAAADFAARAKTLPKWDGRLLVKAEVRGRGLAALGAYGLEDGAATGLSAALAGFTRLDATVAFDDRGLALDFDLKSAGAPPAGAKARLEKTFKAIFDGPFMKGFQLTPHLTLRADAAPTPGGEVLISTESLRTAGKAFNAFILESTLGSAEDRKKKEKKSKP